MPLQTKPSFNNEKWFPLVSLWAMGANQTVIKVKLDLSSQETQSVCCKVQFFNSIAERLTTVLKK